MRLNPLPSHKKENASGFFPTLLYLKVRSSDALEHLMPLKNAYTKLLKDHYNLDIEDDEIKKHDIGFHVSLSRTWYLRQHQLEAFARHVAQQLCRYFSTSLCILLPCSPLCLLPNKLNPSVPSILGNNWFGVLEFNLTHVIKLQILLQTIDEIAEEFGYPKFYTPSRPHISLFQFKCPDHSFSDDQYLTLPQNNSICLTFPYVCLRIGKRTLKLRPSLPIHSISQELFFSSNRTKLTPASDLSSSSGEET